MIVLRNTAEAVHLRAALDSYIHRRGVDRVPAGLVDIAAQLASTEDSLGLSQPSTANPLPNGGQVSDGALVSHREAAELLGVSLRTVGRMVAAGDLTQTRRRITLSSIQKATR